MVRHAVRRLPGAHTYSCGACARQGDCTNKGSAAEAKYQAGAEVAAPGDDAVSEVADFRRTHTLTATQVTAGADPRLVEAVPTLMESNPVVAPGGGAAGGNARAPRGTVEAGAPSAASERPPRANSADAHDVHNVAATARMASGGALVAIGRWQGTHRIGADAPLDAAAVASEPAVDARCLFGLLPFEMLCAVLAWLDWETLLKAVPAVCRTWRAVCRDLVPAVFEFPEDTRLGDGVLRAIWARFKKTRVVTLGWCRAAHCVTIEVVEELVMRCGQLRRLELTRCRLDVARLMVVVRAVPHLQVFG